MKRIANPVAPYIFIRKLRNGFQANVLWHSSNVDIDQMSPSAGRFYIEGTLLLLGWS